MSSIHLTFRRYVDGDKGHVPWERDVVVHGESDSCPTYVHRTPPCQGSCPSGHDIRGWLSISRGLDKPPEGMAWQEHAFRRMTEANPFPAVMGRVCPAPCEDGCNRNQVEEAIGINAVEQYVGDWALANGLSFPRPETETGKRVAVVGGGAAGLAAAYFLRRKGHACTVFEAYRELGGMMVFGIPGYRTPRAVLAGEIQRIFDMGVDVRLDTRVGTDVSPEDLERDFDAGFWAIGAVHGKSLRIPGADAPNCIDGLSYLRAFNEGRLKYLTGRVVVIGAGDTAMDVVAVARRLGNIERQHEKDHLENVVLGHTVHDVAEVARRQGADVWIVYRRPISSAPASRHELEAVVREGVQIHENLAPVEVVLGEDGRARALRVVPVDWVDGEMKPRSGEERDIECEMVVSATGQTGDYTGLETFDKGDGLIAADRVYRVVDHPGHFVGGDAVKPHLLTTAIGQAFVAVESIDHYLRGDDIPRRPKVDTHHFNLLAELRARHLAPDPYTHEETWGTDNASFAVHNYEDRSFSEIIAHDEMFLGHFGYEPMHRREEAQIDADSVLGNFEERFSALDEETVVAEAARCMSCGMCFECDNCVIYCPQDAIFRVPQERWAVGRYVDTDYAKCVGCHICMDVCPSGYIRMGLG